MPGHTPSALLVSPPGTLHAPGGQADGARPITKSPSSGLAGALTMQTLKTTGITFKDFKALDAGGPLTAVALEVEQIDVALLFTTTR